MIDVKASAIHGRGVFATTAIEAGQSFHTAHLLIFDGAQHAALQETVACHYVFHVADCPNGSDRDTTGLAMSPISFVNHHRPPNAVFVVDAISQTITFTAARPIAAGEEVTIDYGDFAEKIGIA